MIYPVADTALNPEQRIRDIIGRPIAFYLGLSGSGKRRRVDALLEEIELGSAEVRNRYPGELSGGQKRRIGIARALAADQVPGIRNMRSNFELRTVVKRRS